MATMFSPFMFCFFFLVSPRPTTSPATFFYFSQLPVELRLQVYRASWESRNVFLSRRVVCDAEQLNVTMMMAEIHSVAAFYLRHARVAPGAKQTVRDMAAGRFAKLLRDEEFRSEVVRAIPTLTTSRAAPPTTLFVSRESRRETLRHYRLAFDLPGGTTQVYFNFDLDRLCFNRHVDLWRALRWEDLTELRYLSLVRSAASSLLEHTTRIYLQAQGGLGGDADPRTATAKTMEQMETSMRQLYPNLEEVVLHHHSICKRRACDICKKGQDWRRLLMFSLASSQPVGENHRAFITKWARFRVGDAVVWSEDDTMSGKLLDLHATPDQTLEAAARSVATSLCAFLRWNPERTAEIPILEYRIK